MSRSGSRGSRGVATKLAGLAREIANSWNDRTDLFGSNAAGPLIDPRYRPRLEPLEYRRLLAVGSVPVTEGLVLQLDAQTGVTTSGTDVVGWTDQSGNGNDLSSLGDPQVVTDGLNGLATIAFDGDGDQLQRTDVLTGLPVGAADRTAFVVTKYDSRGFGGVSYGVPATNEVFGVTVGSRGKLAVQGWGRANDARSDEPGSGAGWLIQTAVVADNVLKHYKDGSPIDEQTRTYNTAADGSLVIGAEIDGDPALVMEIAEVLIYDQALSDDQREQVESYLQEKYFNVNQIPAAEDDSDVTLVDTLVTIDVLSNDGLGEDPTTITEVTQGTNGTVDTDGATVSYQPENGFVGTDTFTYTITDVDNESSTATVEVRVIEAGQIISDGLALQLDAQNGVTTDGSTVTGWSDQSGNGNDLSSLGDPQLMPGALNGLDTIAFDGVDDRLERAADVMGLPAGASDRSVFVVTKYDSVGYGGVTYGSPVSNQAFGVVVASNGNLAVQAWRTRHDATSDATGTGSGWLIQSAVVDESVMTHYRNGSEIDVQTRTYNTAADGSLVIGAELDGDPSVNMEVAEVLIYDRALVELERQQIEDYLSAKYFGSDLLPFAEDDSATTEVNTPITIDVISNDFLGDLPTTITAVTQGSVGTVITDGATVTYQPNLDFTGRDSFTYTITDSDGDTSTATVIVDTNPVMTGSQPAAVDDTATTVAGNLVPIDVLANDSLGDLPTTITATTQGSDGAVDTDGAALSYVPNDGFTGTDNFTYTITDVDGETSTATVTVNVVPVGSPEVILDGLALRFDAETGVTTDGSEVLGWSDQSGNGNDLSSLGDPQLVPDGLNGYDTIAFDGDTDRLERLADVAGLPSGSADRSLFVVTKYNSLGPGGVAYGNPTKNQTFGLMTATNGNLAVQGWGRNADQISDEPGTGAGWLVQSVILKDNVVAHYQDGRPIDTQTHAFNTADGGSLMIGTELNGDDSVDMEIAEVLMYDVALSEVDRQKIESYLQNKYFSTNQSPVAEQDSGTTLAETPVVIDVLANDVLGNTPTTITGVTQGTGGTVETDGSTVSYDPDPGFTGTDTFSYTITDLDGETSSADVEVTVREASTGEIYVSLSSNTEIDGTNVKDEDIIVYDSEANTWSVYFDGSDVGLRRQDINAFQIADNGTIYLSMDEAANVSGLGTVDDSDILMFTPTSLGSSTEGTFELFFDGSDYGLSKDGEDVDAISFTPEGMLVISTTAGYNVDAAGGGTLQGGDEDLIVLDEDAGGFSIFLDGSEVSLSTRSEDVAGATVDPVSGDVYLTTIGNFSVPGLSGDADDVFVYRGTTGANASGVFSAFFDGDNAGIGGEVIDAITIQSSGGSGGSGGADSNNVPQAEDDIGTTPEATPVTIDVLTNDALGDEPTAITEVTQGSDGTVDIDGSSVVYDPDPGFEGTDTFTYTIVDADGESSTATVTVTVTPVISDTPLDPVLDLQSDTGISENEGLVERWDDQSGNGNHVSSAGERQPEYGSATTPSGQTAVRFDGVNDRLLRTFSEGFTGLPEGNASRTAFLVVQVNNANWHAGAAYGAAGRNQAFGVGVAGRGDDEGKAIVQGYGRGNDAAADELLYTPPRGPSTGWTILTVVHQDDGADPANNTFLYKDGVEVIAWDHQFNTNLGNGDALNEDQSISRIVLGQEIGELGAVEFDVAAYVVYDSALSTGDIEIVEAFLEEKYLTIPVAQNSELNQDVNGDGSVSSLDALVVINEISTNDLEGESIGDPNQQQGYFTDVNGDGQTTALDALQVINYLSTMELEVQTSGESVPTFVMDPGDDDEDDLLTLLAEDALRVAT